jgi:regulator of cell morphogenesis and NO signaling
MYAIDKYLLTADVKVAEAIAENPYLMLLLEHFDIALPIQEKKVNDLCSEYSINLDLFLTFANLYNGVKYLPEKSNNFSDAPTIINYLKIVTSITLKKFIRTS